jgi:hypothetical protein
MASAKIYDMGGTDGHWEDDVALQNQDTLENYVIGKVQEWSDHVEGNYQYHWEEYNRIFRGIWSKEDSTRETERSRIISPATTQAVEDGVADIEEATFSSGKLFSIKDDVADQDPKDIEFLSRKLTEEFHKNKIRKEVCDVLLNAAIFGTGIAEVVIDEIKDMAPATQPIMDGQMQAVGVNVVDRTVVKMRSIQPRNFRIDPTARTIDEAHGVAIDEFVPRHTILELQEKGVYKDVPVGGAPQDYNIEVDPELDIVAYQDKVRLTKYFGKVPRHLLEAAQNSELSEDEEYADISDPMDVSDASYYVEAIVIIANEGECVLKAEENPYMMQDRPVVAFQWDVTPGVFWGRGIVEKAFNSQKALDAEIRARIDALALTVHPMLAMDATRIPRGHTPQVRPGKMILTNGDPREVLQPFNFGNVDQITFSQAEALQLMLRQATGTMDGAALSGIGSNNKTGAVSTVLGAMAKRQKRTLVHFQECFWIPFIEKAAWRYMQFDPENFPVSDYKFVAQSSLNLMSREYEVANLTQLLQTMGQDSPMYPALVQAIVSNMNLSNSEELLAVLEQASQPNPEQQKMEQEMHQMQMELQKAQISAVDGQGNESNARAEKYKVEAQAIPQEMEIKKIDAITKNLQPGAEEDQEFTRRLKIAETRLKEKSLNIQEQDLRMRRENEARAKKMLNTED